MDKTKVAEFDKAIPATHLFIALSFAYNSKSAEKENMNGIIQFTEMQKTRSTR